jgi:RepB DNA-primase from phage plasmid
VSVDPYVPFTRDQPSRGGEARNARPSSRRMPTMPISSPASAADPVRPSRIRLIAPNGDADLVDVDASGQLTLWLSLLLGGETGVAELAAGRRDSLGRLRIARRRDPRAYPRANDTAELTGRALAFAADGREVFCGPLPRDAALPGSAGVTGGRVLWVDLDDAEALARLAVFAPRPCLIVSSGGSGGAHAYWRLTRRLPGRVLEAANAALARELIGDPAVKDRGRLMRLPGTVNGKTGHPCRLLRADLRPERVDPDALLGPRFAAPEPVGRPEAARRIGLRHDPLRDLDPPSYFAALCGIDTDPDALVACPLPDHDDRTPSCRVYATAQRGWWCFGCARGGRIYDLASLLQGGPWGRELRGEPFRRARELVRERLGIRAAV